MVPRSSGREKKVVSKVPKVPKVPKGPKVPKVPKVQCRQTIADHGRPKHSDTRGATSISDAFS